MAHAPWIYGWWAAPMWLQADVVLAEAVFLFMLFTLLTALAFRDQAGPDAADPAVRMLEPDPPGPGDGSA
jgi:hypothetical protein